MAELKLDIGAVPVTPPAGTVTIYPKSDKRLYTKDDAGVESAFSAPSNTDQLPEGSAQYFTPERAQDAIGSILTATADVAFTYNDFLNQITAALVATGVTAGTYTKVTIDANGRVLSTSNISPADLPAFQGAGIGHAAGLVPDPGSTPGSTRYLREDGTWSSVPVGGAAGGVLTGFFPNPGMASDAVDTAQIKNGAVTDAKIVAVAYGKLTGAPAALPPSGSAGGDLTGTYPTPSLTTTGVTPGTYPKVTVDSKGRVSSGAALVAADIPSLPFSKLPALTANKALVSDGSGFPSAGAASDTEISFLAGVTSAIQAQINLKQLQDPDLDALAAVSAIGLLVRTAGGAAAARTLQVTAGDITIANPAGTAGDPLLALANTGITAGSYGTASQAMQATVDAKGRLTALSLLAISILSSQVSDFGSASATVADARIALQKATANGLATLDGSGRIPASQLSLDASEYKGSWSAAANTPSLSNASGNQGDFYKVSTSGTVDFGAGPITFRAGEQAVYNGTIWERIGTDDAVNSVNGLVGAVSLTTDTVPEGGAQYFTPERAQDAVGGALLDTSTIAWDYNDAANQISAAIVAGSIGDTQIAGAANIALTKLASVTASKAVVSDGSGKLTASTASAAEVAFLAGVTSAIQTQLNNKQAAFSILSIASGGTNSGTALIGNRNVITTGGAIVEGPAITANKALASDSNGIPVATAVTDAELAFLSGVASGVQAQINGKQAADSDLTAVAALSTTGLIARTATGAASTRTVTGTAGEITVVNGDGVAGDPILSLQATGVVAGTYGGQEKHLSLQLSNKGRVFAVNEFVPMQLQTIQDTNITVPDGYTWIRAPHSAFLGTTKITLTGTASLFFAR